MIKIIVAISENGVIGKDNELPWNLRDDLRWFKESTLNHPVVMGSRTFDSIVERLKKPLPHRENIVLTRNPSKIQFSDVTAIDDFKKIIERSISEDIFVIGGAEVYKLALPFADEIYLTQVRASVEGNVYFPEWNKAEWELIFSEHMSRDQKNEFDFDWEIYRRLGVRK
jgi:dihydrofolate reductase